MLETPTKRRCCLTFFAKYGRDWSTWSRCNARDVCDAIFVTHKTLALPSLLFHTQWRRVHVLVPARFAFIISFRAIKSFLVVFTSNVLLFHANKQTRAMSMPRWIAIYRGAMRKMFSDFDGKNSIFGKTKFEKSRFLNQQC